VGRRRCRFALARSRAALMIRDSPGSRRVTVGRGCVRIARVVVESHEFANARSPPLRESESHLKSYLMELWQNRTQGRARAVTSTSLVGIECGCSAPFLLAFWTCRLLGMTVPFRAFPWPVQNLLWCAFPKKKTSSADSNVWCILDNSPTKAPGGFSTASHRTGK